MHFRAKSGSKKNIEASQAITPLKRPPKGGVSIDKLRESQIASKITSVKRPNPASSESMKKSTRIIKMPTQSN